MYIYKRYKCEGVKHSLSLMNKKKKKTQ